MPCHESTPLFELTLTNVAAEDRSLWKGSRAGHLRANTRKGRVSVMSQPATTEHNAPGCSILELAGHRCLGRQRRVVVDRQKERRSTVGGRSRPGRALVNNTRGLPRSCLRAEGRRSGSEVHAVRLKNELPRSLSHCICNFLAVHDHQVVLDSSVSNPTPLSSSGSIRGRRRA